MSTSEMEALVGRVQNGFLFHATETEIRAQLQSEGVSSDKINAAIARGKRLADVRVGRKF